MNGPSEFHRIGSAVGWSVTGRLGAIGCAAMTRITPATRAARRPGRTELRGL
jgi:hypothetical protein